MVNAPRRPRVTQQIECGQLDGRHFHPARIRLAILDPAETASMSLR